MIQITTRFFGALECPEEAIIHFPSGIPPFSDQQAFVVLSKEDSPFVFLQSVAAPELCFLTVPVPIIDPAYRLKIEPFDLSALTPEGAEPCAIDKLTCLSILTIPEQGATTANLAAPILINPATNIGVQAVRSDCLYSHAHPLEQVTT